MIAAPGGTLGLPAFDRIAFVDFHGFIGDFWSGRPLSAPESFCCLYSFA
jgi:hypothetical protein